VPEKQYCCFSLDEFILFSIHPINVGGTMMKNTCVFLAILAMSVILDSPGLWAQSIDQRLQSFASEYAKGYVQPLVDAVGANLNSGLYQSADTESELDIYAGVKVIGTFITSDMQTFNASSPYNGQVSSTATILGGNGADIPGAITPPSKYLNGAAAFGNVKLVPLFVPQASVGNFMGTQLMIRYLPAQNVSDVGQVSFWGVGVQHSLSQYIPMIPFCLAAQVAYQNLTVGDNFDASALSIGVQASKKILILTLYGGVAYERCGMTLSYTYTQPGTSQTQKLSLDFTGENTVRATVGASINVLLFKINADYSLGKIPVGSVGIGIGL
jgi:hypothetical protein